MPEILFWWWVVLAAILIVAEIFTSGFFLLPFGLGAAVAALVQFLGGTIAWQLAAFLVVSTTFLVSLRRFAQRMTHDSPERVGAERLVGRTAIVIEDIDAQGESGRVRVQKEEWRAEPSTRRMIPFGTTVLIERVDGAHLVVRPESAHDPHLPDHSSVTAVVPADPAPEEASGHAPSAGA